MMTAGSGIAIAGAGQSKSRRLRPLIFTLFAAACAISSLPAQASGVISFGDDKSISLGLGLRGSFESDSYGAPNGTSRSADFNLDSVRLYISGSVNSWIKATFNTERNSNGNVNVLDGYAQFEPMDEINFWVGRMLPPSDRANLDGPYYLNTYAYPGIVSQYPSKFDGRDDGATVWGKLFEKKLVYSLGAFNGHNRISGASNQSDNVLFAGRVAYNFLDPEPDPAYYTSSTYYGAVDVLTIAFAGQFQSEGVGTISKHGDYGAWNVDALFEKKLPGIGVVTLEGAYYDYETDGVTDVPTNFNGAGPFDNVGGITQGTAYLFGAAYMYPEKIGYGFVQPVIRYQEFDADLTKTSQRRYDLGVNYVIDGHNARITANYAKVNSSTAKSDDEFIIGVQLQI